MDLDNNTQLQAALKQRRMIQDSLRQAMTIQPGAKGGGGKGQPGAIAYAWGAGSNGQLGQPIGASGTTMLRSINSPATVKFDNLSDSVVRVASGNSHVQALTDSGECFAWGDGRSQQLGYVMARSNNQSRRSSWIRSPRPQGRRRHDRLRPVALAGAGPGRTRTHGARAARPARHRQEPAVRRVAENGVVQVPCGGRLRRHVQRRD